MGKCLILLNHIDIEHQNSPQLMTNDY